MVLEAVAAVNRLVAGRPEGHTGGLAAVGTHCLEQLAWAALAALGWLSFRSAPAPGKVHRFEIPAAGPFRSENQTRIAVISPDGSAVAHVEGGRLQVRRLQRLEPLVIPTAAPAELLFWSPDSAWIGYTAAGRMFKVPAGGEPFEGFRWRNDERLQLNFLWLLTYVTRAQPGQVSKIWIDDVVVAREYVGPLAKRR